MFVMPKMNSKIAKLDEKIAKLAELPATDPVSVN